MAVFVSVNSAFLCLLYETIKVGLTRYSSRLSGNSKSLDIDIAIDYDPDHENVSRIIEYLFAM